jgi:hypothetical protein
MIEIEANFVEGLVANSMLKKMRLIDCSMLEARLGL